MPGQTHRLASRSHPAQRGPRQIETLPLKKSSRKNEKTIAIVSKTATIRANLHLIHSCGWVSQGVVFDIKDEFTDDAAEMV
jgi:hypothetical protein